MGRKELQEGMSYQADNGDSRSQGVHGVLRNLKAIRTAGRLPAGMGRTLNKGKDE